MRDMEQRPWPDRRCATPPPGAAAGPANAVSRSARIARFPASTNRSGSLLRSDSAGTTLTIPRGTRYAGRIGNCERPTVEGAAETEPDGCRVLAVAGDGVLRGAADVETVDISGTPRRFAEGRGTLTRAGASAQILSESLSSTPTRAIGAAGGRCRRGPAAPGRHCGTGRPRRQDPIRCRRALTGIPARRRPPDPPSRPDDGTPPPSVPIRLAAMFAERAGAGNADPAPPTMHGPPDRIPRCPSAVQGIACGATIDLSPAGGRRRVAVTLPVSSAPRPRSFQILPMVVPVGRA